MNADNLNELWYRVRDVRLTLRSHVKIYRHIYRGKIWFVVQDRTTGRFFRLSPAAYKIIGRLDGSQTLDEVWNNTENKLEIDITKGQLIRLLSQLYKADLLLGDVLPNTKELVSRAQQFREKLRAQRWRSPIAIRLPILDPDRFLNKTMPIVRHLFGMVGFIVWLAVIIFGATLFATNWEGLSKDVIGRVISAENALLLLVIFPIVKIFHEFGHAYAVKSIGGEVHEMGIIFLVFIPIPYVDASSANANANKFKRAMVGAAGMFVELFLAVLALVVWSESESGMVKAIAYNVILVAGVSTIFFNANPLVRFDGYYILADLIEIPNLSSRSYQYLAHLYQKHVIQLPDSEKYPGDKGEKFWLVFYAISSFLYRILIITVIVWFLVDSFFVFGLLIAFWAVLIMVVLPLRKTIMFLFKNNRLHGYRVRAISITVALLVGILGLISIPIPFSSIAEGVVWVDQQSWVRNKSEGFVKKVNYEQQGVVHAGQAIAVLDNIDFDVQLQRLNLYLKELTAQFEALRLVDRVQAQIVEKQIIATKTQVQDFEDRRNGLIVRSKTKGRFISLTNEDIIGKFLPKGSLLGFVADEDASIVRVVVSQQDIDLVRHNVDHIEIRFADKISKVFVAEIVREIPSATQALPSLALSSEGGGNILLDPSMSQENTPSALRSFFQFDLRVLGDKKPEKYGGRVYVRFSFGYKSIAKQLYRPIRQTFLSKFG